MKRNLIILFLTLTSSMASRAQEWKLYYDSSKVVGQYDWIATANLLKKALPLVSKDEKNYDDVYLQITGDLGIASLNAGEVEDAVVILSDVFDKKEKKYGASHRETLITELNLAEAKIKLGKLEQAEALLTRIIKANRETVDGHLTLFVQSHLKLARLYESMSRFQQAEIIYKDLIDKNKSASASARINHQMGNFYFKVGKYHEAKAMLTASYRFYAEQGKKFIESYIESANSLSRLYITLGSFKKAEALLQSVFAITNKFIGLKRTAHATTLSNLANLNRQLGNFDKSETYFLDMLEIYQSLGQVQTPHYATALNNLANLYGAIGHYEHAEKMYKEAGQIYLNTNGKYSRPYANTLNNLAGLFRKSGELKKATDLYKECLQIDAKTIGLFHPDYATILNNLGILQTIEGNNKEAKSSFIKALKIRLYTLGETHSSYTNTLNNLALLYMIEGDLEAATPLLKKGITNHLLQLNTVFPMLSEKEKEAFYQMVKSDFERFNTFVVDQYKNDVKLIGFLYNVHLATKSMLFRATDRMRKNILNSGDTSLINDFNIWKSTKETLAFYYQLPKNQLSNMLKEVQDLESKANELEKNISLKSIDFAKEVNNKTYSWQEIQKQLKPGEAAIEMIRFRDYNINKTNTSIQDENSILPKALIHGFSSKVLYAAIILTPETKDHPKLVILNNGKALEGEYYSFYQNAIKFGMPDTDSFKRYWGDIAKNIPNAKKIYFSPDGIYNLLNVNTLFDSKEKKYLLETLDVNLVTNTYEIMIEEKSNYTDKTALIIGDPNFDILPKWRQKINTGEVIAKDEIIDIDKSNKDYYGWAPDLPGTADEIRAIDSLLVLKSWKSILKQNNEATESSIKSADNPRLLHIATHGFFDEKIALTDSLAPDIGNNPLLRAGLMLAGANVTNYRKAQNIANEINLEDGILTAYEAMNLNLDQTELVILSACETGLGELKYGEGVFGLQRAFRVAGAKNILISLRKVNDQATKMLISDFYKRWMATGDIKGSFKAAQIALQSSFPSPYFWGAFVLVSGN